MGVVQPERKIQCPLNIWTCCTYWWACWSLTWSGWSCPGFHRPRRSYRSHSHRTQWSVQHVSYPSIVGLSSPSSSLVGTSRLGVANSGTVFRRHFMPSQVDKYAKGRGKRDGCADRVVKSEVALSRGDWDSHSGYLHALRLLRPFRWFIFVWLWRTWGRCFLVGTTNRLEWMGGGGAEELQKKS